MRSRTEKKSQSINNFLPISKSGGNLLAPPAALDRLEGNMGPEPWNSLLPKQLALSLYWTSKNILIRRADPKSLEDYTTDGLYSV